MKKQIPLWLMWLALVLLAFTVGASCYVILERVQEVPAPVVETPDIAKGTASSADWVVLN